MTTKYKLTSLPSESITSLLFFFMVKSYLQDRKMHFKILNAFNVTVPWRVLRKLVLLSLHPTSLPLPPLTWSSCCDRPSAQHCTLSLKWHIALSKQSLVQESLAFTVTTTNHKMFKLFRHLVVYIFKFLLVFLVV